MQFNPTFSSLIFSLHFNKQPFNCQTALMLLPDYIWSNDQPSHQKMPIKVTHESFWRIQMPTFLRFVRTQKITKSPRWVSTFTESGATRKKVNTWEVDIIHTVKWFKRKYVQTKDTFDECNLFFEDKYSAPDCSIGPKCSCHRMGLRKPKHNTFVCEIQNYHFSFSQHNCQNYTKKNNFVAESMKREKE